MQFDYTYKGSSQVSDRADRTDMSFAPDTKREPTFFRGQLAKQVPFREAESSDSLAERLGLERAVVLGALGAYTQAGRAIYDLNKQVYRVRELSHEPLPMDKLRFANEREQTASRLLKSGKVRVTARELAAGAIELQGVVRHKDKAFGPMLVLDADQRMFKAECSCNFHQQNKLFKGPCEHILAARMWFTRHGAVAELPPRSNGAQSDPSSGRPSSGSAQPTSRPSASDGAHSPGQGTTRAMRRRFRKALRRRGDAQLVDLGLDRALRLFVDRGLIEIQPRNRDKLIEEMLSATFRAYDLDTAIDLVLTVLTRSDLPEEVYGEDAELEQMLRDAFESALHGSDD